MEVVQQFISFACFKYRSLRTLRISLSVLSSGEMPPWTHKKRLSSTAERGRARKDATQASYTSCVYFRVPVNERKNMSKIALTGNDCRERKILM